ncbi:MAG: amidohydrolase [Anaerolineales bacterium]
MRILYNTRINTLDTVLPSASAIVIDHGRIQAVGDQGSLLSQYNSSIKRVDLGGRTVIPGLTDAHIHLQYYSLSLQRVDCESSTREESLNNVAARVEITPYTVWILGHGWNQNQWPEGFGNTGHLDKITTQHPIYLTAKSLHAAWVNSAALRQAGVSAQTPDPPGGRIQRHTDGSPTGILFETAMSLVSDIIPESSPEQVAKDINNAQTKLWKMGITGVHDFDQRTCFVALQQLHAAGRLKLRVTKSIPIESLSDAIDLGLQTGFGDDVLRIGSIKAFADGALGTRTAAMLQPYEGEPENRGLLMLDAENLFEQGRLAVKNGLSLAVHAIGDSANHEVLQALSQLREYEDQHSIILDRNREPRKLRHRIEHVQLIHPDDLPRLAGLNVIASMQPIHATSDFPTADQYWGKRSRYSYAWRSLLDEGTLLAFGSDAPVESPNPFWGLHAAVSRKRVDGSPGPQGWYPEQKLSLAAALHGFTSGAAYAAGMEDRLGKLAPGFLADLLVLDQDIFQVSLDEIRDIRPLGTMIAGEWVHLDPVLDELISNDGHPLP